MTGPGALATTGAVLAFAAFVAALSVDGRRRRASLLTTVALLLFTAACACTVGAAWWEALS